MNKISKGAVALLPLAVAGVASAQSGLTVRAGGTYPINKDVRDGIDKNGFGFGAALAISKLPYIPGDHFLTLDFNRVVGGNNRIDSWSLGILTRIPLGLFGGRFYGGLGAGVAYNALWAGNTNSNVKDQKVSANGLLPSTSRFVLPSTSRFGNQTFTATALIGTQIRQNWNLELQYRHINKIQDANPSSLGLYLGYTF